MTAPGGRGEVPSPNPSSLARRRPSIAVSDLMSGGDGPSRRHAGEDYPPPTRHAPAVTQHSHNPRATPTPPGLPPPPPHHNPPSNFAYRRDLSPEGSRGMRHFRGHPGAPGGAYATHGSLHARSPNTPQPQPPLPPRHQTDPGEDRRAREYEGDSSRPYDRRGVPGDKAESEDPRRVPYRYEYGRDYPHPDRPPRVSSPPPLPRSLGPSNVSASTALPHEHAPAHAYPLSGRAPPTSSGGLALPVAEANYVSGGPITNSPSGTSGSPSLPFEAHRSVGVRPRSPLPGSAPPTRESRSSRGERDDLFRGRPTPPPLLPSSQPRTYFTPAPRYSIKGLSPNDVQAYNRGWTEAMEAVQQGVVWIDGTAYSHIPMYIPDADRGGQLVDSARREHFGDRGAPGGERGYGREPPPSAWDVDRSGKREQPPGPHYAGPSRSHSAPVPRSNVAPPHYPPHEGYYGPNGPPPYPPYAIPPHMEQPGPHHYPAPGYMPGPPMPPHYLGPDHYPPYGYGMHPSIRPQMQSNQMRSRQQISCHPCRNRKVKCSGTTPCDACIKIKREHECQYEKTVRRRGKGKKGGAANDGDDGDSRDKTDDGGRHDDNSGGERHSDDDKSQWHSESPPQRGQREFEREREHHNNERKPEQRDQRDHERERGRERSDRDRDSDRSHDHYRDRDRNSHRERESRNHHMPKRQRSRSRSPPRRPHPAPPASSATMRKRASPNSSPP